jgi:hypothetical protein
MLAMFFWGHLIQASLTTVASCSAAKVAIAFVVGWSNIKVLGNL